MTHGYLKTLARNNNRGAAMTIVLFIMVILLFLSNIFVLRTVHERNMAVRERETAKAFYAAHGGTRVALDALDNLINNFLNNTIASSNPSSVISFTTSHVNSDNGIGWLVYSVRDDNNIPVLTQVEDQAEYTANGSIGDNTYQYKIVMMEKSDPVTITTNVWDFPFNYRVESTGTSAATTSKILLSGDFTVRVQRDNFAKYSLFTNSQTMQSGAYVWFTNKTNFAGPVHTNARFNFALNPSGTFDDAVTQPDQLARFYNNGSPLSLDANFNGTRDVPVFNDTFTRGAGAITLTSPTQMADMENQAKGGQNQNYNTNGIYVPNSGGSLTGGVYIRGNGNINMALDANNNAVYTISQGSSVRTITVDKTANTTTVVGSTTTTYNGIPDGVDNVGTIIYATGSITSLGGTVQSETEMTIGSGSDIVITDHLAYQNYTPASGTPGQAGYQPPTADGATNLLGLVSWNGNVRIGAAAPDNINIHSTILARNGVFQVDNYNNTLLGPRGTATLLGGAITNNYGAFGLFNGSTGQQTAGYGRNFVYDDRMEVGNAPPYFPSLNTFIAFTNGIADKIVWQEGGTW